MGRTKITSLLDCSLLVDHIFGLFSDVLICQLVLFRHCETVLLVAKGVKLVLFTPNLIVFMKLTI